MKVAGSGLAVQDWFERHELSRTCGNLRPRPWPSLGALHLQAHRVETSGSGRGPLVPKTTSLPRSGSQCVQLKK